EHRTRFLPSVVECLTVKVHQQLSPNRYNDKFVSFNYKSDQCISTSGDQKLCDELDKCIQELPKTLLDNFNECLKQTYSDGKLGKCNDKENLFGTPKELQQYFQCFVNKLPQKSDLSDDEQKQLTKSTSHAC
ncbi:uncharacterized protein TNCT_293941, partial [Trichonephila clavata]